MSYFLGNVLGACLYGALTVQLYRYYISFPNDRILLKAVIYIVYVTETIFTGFLIYDLSASLHESSIVILDLVDPVNDSGPLVTRTGVPRPCNIHFLVSLIIAVCGGAVELLTQSIYAYRIRIITQLKCIPWVIILVITLKLVAFITSSLVLGTAFIDVAMLVWHFVSMVVDVTIMCIMVWFLKKDEIYSKELKNKIAQLVYLVIGTGFLTAGANICLLVLIFTPGHYTIGVMIVLSKLYANSMMVLVNSRIPSARSEIKNRATLDIVTIRLSTFHVRPQGTADMEHTRINQSGRARSVGLSACQLTV